jgi:hypothetical protein
MSGTLHRIHSDGFDTREIDDKSTIARAKPRDTVPAASHRQSQTLILGESDATDYVSNIGAFDDEPRTTIDHCVVNTTSRLVALVGWTNGPAPQPRYEIFHHLIFAAHRNCCNTLALTALSAAENPSLT